MNYTKFVLCVTRRSSYTRAYACYIPIWVTDTSTIYHEGGLLGVIQSRINVTMLRFSSLVLLLAGIYAADAFPGGAPLSACDDLTPDHRDNLPQMAEVPYVINLTQFSDGNQYIPDQTYTRKPIGYFFTAFYNIMWHITQEALY